MFNNCQAAVHPFCYAFHYNIIIVSADLSHEPLFIIIILLLLIVIIIDRCRFIEIMSRNIEIMKTSIIDRVSVCVESLSV